MGIELLLGCFMLYDTALRRVQAAGNLQTAFLTPRFVDQAQWIHENRPLPKD